MMHDSSPICMTHPPLCISLQAARELLRLEMPEMLKLSSQHPGFEIQVVGHSLGGWPGQGLGDRVHGARFVDQNAGDWVPLHPSVSCIALHTVLWCIHPSHP